MTAVAGAAVAPANVVAFAGAREAVRCVPVAELVTLVDRSRRRIGVAEIPSSSQAAVPHDVVHAAS